MDNSVIKTPFYLIDEGKLKSNLEILRAVKNQTGCKILLAQKAFSSFYFYPLIASYLDGTTASGLNEARLGFEEFGGETHIFSPSYLDFEFDEILHYCDHIVFNSINQLNKFKDRAILAKKEIGLRINPECSTQSNPLYDPCSRYSRMGVRECDLTLEVFSDISGIHFHTLCEQNVDALKTTLDVVEKRFGRFFHNLKWVNFGGGHHITRADYDLSGLIKIINDFKEKYQVEVYLEPGEAVVLNCGSLVSSVLEIVENEKLIAILDASAACHMPDVLEVPYQPNIKTQSSDGGFSYRLCGNTCLSGDVIGDYNFEKPLNIGSKLEFLDMALYTIVKNNTFNGINLPSIAVKKQNGQIELIKKFDYFDFKNRLS